MSGLDHNSAERRLNDIQDTQDGLREKIDRMPDGPEREQLIDQLFTLHAEALDILEAGIR